MKLKLLFFILISCIYSLCVFSQNAETNSKQNRTIDSLKNLLYLNVHDTVKLKILSDLNWLYSGINAIISKEYGFQELTLSNKIGNKKWIAQSYNDIGIANYKLGLLDTALYYYDKSLVIRKILNDKNLIASSLSKIAVVYQEQGEFNKSLEYNIKVLKIYEDSGNDNYLAMTLNNISAIYDKLNNYDKVIEYGEKAVAIHLKNKNYYQAAYCYANLASAYKTKRNIKKSDEYLHKALMIYVKFKDKNNEAAVLNSIGLNLRQDKKDKEALVYYQKAFEISKQINDKLSMGLYAHNLSGLYSDIGNYQIAEKFALIALGNTELTNKYQTAMIYRQLANLNAYLNNGKMAKYYIDRFADLKDSLYNIESSGQMAEMETKYQTEKKDKELIIKDAEIVKQQADATKKAIQRNAFLIGFFIILIFLTLLFRLFLQKKKANLLLAAQKNEIEEKNEVLNQQNEEISSQRDEIESQRDQLEEQKQEITDSINYAKRIQQAVITNLELLLSNDNQPCLPAGRYSVIGKHTTDYRLPITDYFVLFKPKDIVSGDFYWAVKINEWFILTVADCTGHGVPGAFMSMLGISFLNEIVRKKEITQASQVLDNLRESIIEALQQKGKPGEQKDGMDIAFCAINSDTLEMQFAGANNPCYIIANTQPVIAMAQPEAISTAQSDCFVPRNDDCQLIELKGDKQPIGIHSNMYPFTNQIYQLHKGDTIYLVSDGYEDQFGGPHRKKFLAKNLKNLLIANCQQPMAEQKQILETTIREWIGKGEQIDDITILGIKL